MYTMHIDVLGSSDAILTATVCVYRECDIDRNMQV